MNDEFPMIVEREAGMHDNVPAVMVGFGFYPIKDGRASVKEGRDVYKDVEFVRIAVPGDRNSLFFQPAEEIHKQRFPKAYDAFKQRKENPTDGTPIEQWPPISRAVALNLKTAHVHTVEALAEVHDGLVDRLGMNGRELREKAKAWISSAKSGAETTRLAAEKSALQDQLEAMQAQIIALQSQSEKSDASAAAARKPRKQAAA
jgi:hypothetical protein